MRAPRHRAFVGGLSWETDDDDLRQAFARFGTVLDAKVPPSRAAAPAQSARGGAETDAQPWRESAEAAHPWRAAAGAARRAHTHVWVAVLVRAAALCV